MTIFVDGYGSKIRKVNRYRPGWERDHPLSTYATGGMEGADRGEGGGVIQNVYKCVQGEEEEKSIIRYVRTKWMVRNKCCRMFFMHWFAQIH